MPQISYKSSVIRVNDIFDELSDENIRLLNELIFANKCLNVLRKYKTFVDLVFDKLRDNLESNDSQNLKELNTEIEEVLKRNPFYKLNEENCVKLEFLDIDSNQLFGSNHCIEETIEKTFYCEVDGCQYKTYLKRNLMNHMNYGHKDGIKPFRCGYSSCGKRFFSEQSLNCHIKIGHKFRDKYQESKLNKHIGRYKCDFNGCDYETRIKKLFINHTNQHKGIKPFICDFISCGKSFISEEGLKSHVECVHKNIRKFKCDFFGCDYETRNRSRITNHMNSVHKGIRPFECTLCKSSFGCKSYLRDHIRMVHESDPNAFKCGFPGCVKSFRDNKYLKHHYKTVHLKIKKDRKREVPCDQPGCQYMAECEAILKIHKASHSNERPFICHFEGCNKSFKVKGSLKAHIEETHLGKTFKCEAIDCGMIFTNRTTWKNHFNSIHSDKILSCDWPGCDYTSKLERNLRKHKLVHKTVSDYVCDWPECHKSFKSRAYLVQHLRIHNNDKRFTCNWPGCHYRCAHSGNIHKHRKIHQK